MNEIEMSNFGISVQNLVAINECGSIWNLSFLVIPCIRVQNGVQWIIFNAKTNSEIRFAFGCQTDKQQLTGYWNESETKLIFEIKLNKCAGNSKLSMETLRKFVICLNEQSKQIGEKNEKWDGIFFL